MKHKFYKTTQPSTPKRAPLWNVSGAEGTYRSALEEKETEHFLGREATVWGCFLEGFVTKDILFQVPTPHLRSPSIFAERHSLFPSLLARLVLTGQAVFGIGCGWAGEGRQELRLRAPMLPQWLHCTVRACRACRCFLTYDMFPRGQVTSRELSVAFCE